VSDCRLVIIGDGPMLDMATAIAKRTRSLGHVAVERLSPQNIASSALSCLDTMEPETTEVFAAIGQHALNYARFDLWAKLRLRGFRAATLIDPSACVTSSSQLAENCLVGPCASVGPNAALGVGTVIEGGAQISGDADVGRFVWIAANATLGAGASIGQHTSIGSCVSIAPGVRIGGHCDVAQSGSYFNAIADGTFVSANFSHPVRMYRAQLGA
jgi:UDP-3-O-[3-hydroxymyristoyl] glucosamine N-acyltransferase